MDVDTIHAMKPVLVTDVSDDINVLQKDDVTKQRTVLTARAIEDVFKCAPIIQTNESVALHPDNAYFDENGKVDFNKIVTAQSRSIDANSYVHGPDEFNLTKYDMLTGQTGIVDEDFKWAANHSPVVYKPAGFLYVFSILDNSSLAWANYDGKTSIADKLGVTENTENDADIAQRKVSDRQKSLDIRQIFVPTHWREYLDVDGTKDPVDQEYERLHRTRYNQGIPLTRIGYLQEDGTYSWGDWYIMSKEHNGPEYYTNISIFGEDRIENPLADAVYHIYGNVGAFILPNANLDAYKIGQKIIVEVHPPVATGDPVPSCLVVYSDTNATGGYADIQNQQVLVTPHIRRNTKDVYGNVSDSQLITSVASFEIVECRDDDGQVYRTWELDVGIQDTDYTAGLAQMLGEHTDTVVPDIVLAQEQSRQYSNTIDVIFPCSSCGYVMANFLKTSATPVDSTWTATVEIVNPLSPASFTRVRADETPSSSYVYYVRDNQWWTLAENGGHPTSFLLDKEYYSLELTNCDIKNVIQIVEDTSVRTYANLADITADKMRRFAAYANRGSIIHVQISSTANTISAFKGNLYPTVGFYPDQHDSYINRVCMNPEAFTMKQLQKLYLDGSVVDDIKLFTSEEVYEGILNAPIATRALIEAYAYLAHKLQSKGLLFGNCLRANTSSGMMNEIVDPGTYYITPYSVIQENNNYPPDALHQDATTQVITCDNFNLVVISNGNAPSAIVHEEEGNITAPTRVIQIALMMGDIDNAFTIDTRIGVKEGNTWNWGPWARFNDWDHIANKPIYFRSRWDYIDSPNAPINHIDGNTTAANVCRVQNISNMNQKFQTTSGHRCVHFELYESYISGLMEISADPAYDENVNYDVPQILVGINNLNPGSYGTSTETKHYVVTLHLPDAVYVSSLTAAQKQRRRKIRVLFYGKPDLNGWNSVDVRIEYRSANASNPNYTYQRNWGTWSHVVGSNTNNPSIMSLEFEQMDLPTGERVWSPIEVG